MAASSVEQPVAGADGGCLPLETQLKARFDLTRRR